MTITSAPAGLRPSRRVARTVLVWLLVLPGLAWSVLRLLGAERSVLVQLFAFTPYVAVWSLIPVIVTLALRKWLAGAAAVLAMALLAVCVVPRALPDHDHGPSSGVRMTVMTINMFVGAADPASIVDLVRRYDVGVLAVQEFSPQARAGLSAAGLDAILPYAALADEVGTTGSGLYSRYPIPVSGSNRMTGGNMQVTATVDPPGAKPVQVLSTHPLAPYSVDVLRLWKADLQSLPATGSGTDFGTLRIIMGDFNSTLDHAPVRAAIKRGYRDAAYTTGKGLLGTWGPYVGNPVPPVTLDHVLVDERIGVRDVSVHAVKGSDHRSVIATVTVPAG